MRSSRPLFTDKDAEALSLVGALVGHVARYTVAVIPEEGADLGTGVLVSFRKALYVATARHIAENLHLDKVFLIPRPEAPLEILSREQIEVRLVKNLFRAEMRERFLSAVDDDVALLRFRDRPAELQWMNFFPLDRANSTPVPHLGAFVFGYTWEIQSVHRPRKARAIPRAALGQLKSKGPLPYDPSRDLIVSYYGGDMNPKGMSGGGVWVPAALGGGLFNPDDAVLAGIQVAYFPGYSGKPLLATRIERLKGLLS